MSKKRWSVLGLALGALVLGVLMGLITVGIVAADPTPGVKIQIPRLDIGDVLGTGDWETWIQVQNVSHITDTGAIFVGWGEYSGLCPTNNPGVIVHYCQLIRGNAIWTLRSQLAEEVKSGMIYSVPPDVFSDACQAAEETEGDPEAWRCWLEEWEFGTCEGSGGGWNDPPDPAFGEELAVTVNRYGPNDYGTFVSSTYTGISEEMEGVDPPYEYFAPYVMKGYNGLDTEMTIQNSGELCTSVWIRYKEQGTCATLYDQHIEQLAPGESIQVRVPCDVGQIPCFWLGSAQIRAEQPLGIIVDETSFDEPCEGVNRGTLLTHRARPKVELRDGEEMLDYKVYADLIFREWSGWDASIQVQNLSRTGQHTFVTVDFMDNSGDEILFLADWVCAGGSTTFYLPVVTNLGFDYIGAAEIQSHDQIDYPGTETEAQPIFAVVDLKRPDNPDTPELDAQGGSYNAHPLSQKEWIDEIALPFMAKDARDLYTPWTSMIAIRNNSNCNKIKPTIWFKDETGTLLCQLNSFWLRPKHVKLIDLNNIGCLYPGYIGAAKVVIEPEDVEQLCDADNDGHADNLPIMPSVIVVEKGYEWLGDATKIYEGIPYSTGDKLCDADLLGTVIDSRTKEPITGATVTVPKGSATYDPVDREWDFEDAIDITGPAGMYEIEEIVTFGTLEDDPGEPGTCYTVTVSAAPDYQDSVIPNVCLHCGEDQVLDVELVSTCEYVTVSGTVEDKETGDWLEGVSLTATNGLGSRSATTDVTGQYTITNIPFDPDTNILVTAVFTGYNSAMGTVYIPECGGEALISFQLHQTPMSRILLYGGNFGNYMAADDTCPITDTELISTHVYCVAQDVLQYLGYHVDYTDVWPGDPDLEEYKVIFLLGPGNSNYDQPNAMFTPGQKSQLDLFLRNGGRLVVMSDLTDTGGALWSMAPISVENDLLNALNDLDVEFEDEDNDGWADVAQTPGGPNGIQNALANVITAPDQLTGLPQDVNSLDFNTAISITVDVANAFPGEIAKVNASHTAHPLANVCAADIMAGVTRGGPLGFENGFAGDVVVIGDKDWMDDASWMGTIHYDPVTGLPDYVWPDWPADNENLLLNIVSF
jgi:hypothetical protein